MPIYDLDKNYKSIIERLDAMTATLLQIQRANPDQVWFDSQEFVQIMNVSKRTASQWRKDKLISYSLIGQKIYYRLSDILQFLENHKISSNN